MDRITISRFNLLIDGVEDLLAPESLCVQYDPMFEKVFLAWRFGDEDVMRSLHIPLGEPCARLIAALREANGEAER